MKKILTKLFYVSLLGMLFLVLSCSGGSDTFESEVTPSEKETSDSEELLSFNYDQLGELRDHLEESGVDVSNLELGERPVAAKGEALPASVIAYKITTKSYHPNRSGSLINTSAVILVPNKTWLNRLSKHRIIVAPPPTYTYDLSAPSNAFKGSFKFTDDGTYNYLSVWALQANSGFVVLIPDYPGFGSSLGQCQHPYLDAEALSVSTLDLLKATRTFLSSKGYKYKPELIITGYSLGGFVAASLARKIETTPSLGYEVELLVTGGTPCNLKQILDIARNSQTTERSYFIPYTLWGYKMNAHPYIKVDDILKEPYASQSLKYFNGYEADPDKYLPNKPADLYTEDFIKNLDTDPKFSHIRSLLETNSLKPWKNKCKFVMIHGTSDESVYYQNALDFADQQNKSGGKVTFFDAPLFGHVAGIAPYYVKATLYTSSHK
ncbi:MAG: lipase family protein [Flavobacteriaceae bacterium]|jgi:pimeloyl-ACP methyl ester carboxylesterase|nr:lipase family protein [Flavobacteriaceae bacterium]